MKKILAITLLVLFIDQASKIYIKTHFELNESIPVINGFFNKTFVENPGMAYGFHFGGIIREIFSGYPQSFPDRRDDLYVQKMVERRSF